MKKYCLTLALNNGEFWEFDVNLNEEDSIDQYIIDAVQEGNHYHNAYTVKQYKTVYGTILFHAVSSITYRKMK